LAADLADVDMPRLRCCYRRQYVSALIERDLDVAAVPLIVPLVVV
jgi:hypothetical protein